MEEAFLLLAVVKGSIHVHCIPMAGAGGCAVDEEDSFFVPPIVV
jgi:hypothetical protein